MAGTSTRTARRADAQHNEDKIVRAAIDCLTQNPAVSLGDITTAAGVGRVTVYGHFPSRDAVVEAALVRVLAEGDAVLEGLDLTGDPRQALRVLIEASWLLTAQASAVLEAAQAVLEPARIRELHAGPAHRIQDLLERGQDEQVFRTDLPVSWLTSVLHYVIKGAATDVARGDLDPAEAPRFIAETALAVLQPPQ